MAELNRLCREERLYEFDRWVQAGRPLQAAPGTTNKGRRVISAFEIARNDRSHSLVLLLVCDGYDPNPEAESPLGRALRARRWDLALSSSDARVPEC